MAVALKIILKKARKPGFFPNHYEILGISTFEAYNPKKKLQRLQENKNEILDLNAQTKLTRLINQADKVLKDPDLKLKYDKQLEEYIGDQKETKKSTQRTRRVNKPMPKRASQESDTNTLNEEIIKKSAANLSFLNLIGTLGVIYTDWSFNSIVYTLFLGLIGFLSIGLFSALSIRRFSDVFNEDNSLLFITAGIAYYLFNQELLILLVLSLACILLMKSDLARKSKIIIRVAPVLCGVVFFFSVYSIPALSNKYFPDKLEGIAFLDTTSPKTIIKTFAKVNGKWNIRTEAHPHAKWLGVTVPHQAYEIINTASRKNWYEIVFEHGTGFVHLSSTKSVFYLDTVVVSK